ncbi:putative NBD/HSP70 family sugar kinase [Roseibium hamelinense]|uniref:Putative NBD/HSP70 family sugar kinase n=1 Tax=Roseibium hamelinense TaxID=150831 RepID=A0A562TBR0_9HYPH|nr:ROK family transcriptional regulator [Roseibium hamelinense]TWI90310.1 putative NBD/HSP70 family sugar kinase [Roseibium hamelinense]
MAETGRTARGSNSAQLRRYNERIVLQMLRRAGVASKADLARSAKLTNAAIGGIIQALIDDGLIVETGKRHDGGRGQPATLLKLAARGAFSFGVRVDRTSLETVLIDFEGKVIGRRGHDMILPAPERALEIIEKDLSSLKELLSTDEAAHVAGIGIAQPFNLGSWLRELGLPEANFKKWDDFDLATELETRCKLPTFRENDGTAAAVAELFYGHGRQNDEFLYLFLGPAIGGGLVLNGDVVRGVSGNAGDVAMMPVPPSKLSTAPAPKKNWDILLTRASLVALARHLEPEQFSSLSRHDLQAAASEERADVGEWLEDCVDALTPSVRSAHAILDFPVVIIDSDLDQSFTSKLANLLSASLQEAAPEARMAPDILVGSFSQDASAIGAATLPLFFNFSPRATILTGGKAQGSAGAAVHEEGVPH